MLVAVAFELEVLVAVTVAATADKIGVPAVAVEQRCSKPAVAIEQRCSKRYFHLNGNIYLTGVTFLYYKMTNTYVGDLLRLLGALLTIRYLLHRLRRTFSQAFTIHSDCLRAIQ